MRLLRREYVAVACASALVTLLYALLQSSPGLLYYLSNMLQIGFSLVPLVFAALSLRVNRRDRWFGRVDGLLFVGFLFWFLGEFTWSFYALYLGIEIPYPSVADVFWLVAYPFVILGMVVYVAPFKSAISRRRLLVALVVSVLAAGLVAGGLVLPVLSFSGDMFSDIVGLAYPMLDVALLFASIMGVMLFWGGKITRGWYWLTAGAVLMSVADILFSYFTAAGTYYNGHPLELFFEFSYACFGLALYEHYRGIMT
jgi:hypothetical protein